MEKNQGAGSVRDSIACHCRRIGCAAGRFLYPGGVSIDPDWFHRGGHFETAPLVSMLIFQPNLEPGSGDRVSTVAFNFEFSYRAPIQRSDLSLYLGAGPALQDPGT